MFKRRYVEVDHAAAKFRVVDKDQCGRETYCGRWAEIYTELFDRLALRKFQFSHLSATGNEWYREAI